MWIDTFFQSLKSILLRADLSVWSIASIKLTDIIDILVVSYMIYRVIVWIKKTRAWSLFKGIFVVLFVSIIAYFLNFYTISWLVTNTFGVGLTAVIILFQPEMRKALEQLGRGKVFGSIFGGSEAEQLISKQTIKDVIDAAKEMSKYRTGALIVIENQVSLVDQEQTGIPLDAVISKQLLMNIFEDKTPLHDGAVIIRGNRIAAATCILPLTQERIDRDLGTRHRAAVGISEISDAFVLVVSEETGDISLTLGGKLYRRPDEKEIWSILYKDIEVPKKKLGRWKGRRSDDKKNDQKTQ